MPEPTIDVLIAYGFDARVWAREWLKTIAEHPEIPTDEGAMIGWFANAIMAGYDKAKRETNTEAIRAFVERVNGRFNQLEAQDYPREFYLAFVAELEATMEASVEHGAE